MEGTAITNVTQMGVSNQLVTSRRRELLRVRILAEAATMVALAGALNVIRVFTLPQGGSITLAAMVPIFLVALRRGPAIGIVAGIVFGMVALAEEQFIYYPAQVILDYPLAFGLLGLAGFFRKIPLVGVVVGITARFCSHFFSGILFFASFAPAGISPVVYSALYNGGFLIVEMIISIVIIGILVRLGILDRYL